MTIQKYYLNFDGTCQPKNPGGTAIGSWVICDDKRNVLETGAEVICKGEGATNNVAEWGGLVYGLQALAKHTDGVIFIRGDSLLIINQLKGIYQVRQPHLQVWKEKAVQLLKHFDLWQAQHVRREFNEAADQIGRDKFEELKKS